MKTEELIEFIDKEMYYNEKERMVINEVIKRLEELASMKEAVKEGNNENKIM